jgi:hypothetical protein
MAKKTTPNPSMDGSVSRGIDFNLKKEDLMLLILEGRKEIMENELSKLQTKKSQLYTKLTSASNEFSNKMKKLVLKSLNTEAKRLAEVFGVIQEDDDMHENNMFQVALIPGNLGKVDYTRYSVKQISGTGSSCIKVEDTAIININRYRAVRVQINLTLEGRSFANKHAIYKRKDEVNLCRETSRSFILLDADLDMEEQTKIPEYLAYEKVAKECAQIENLYSDVLSEYDLFGRNHPRAKAKMIKEVLARDEAGQAMLANIITAASGVKLLG